MAFPFRRLVFGSPIPTWRAAHERLPKIIALPVFASDAMSSVAYATEEILIALGAAGIAALSYSIPITFAIILLLAIVATSYRHTVFAYPSGGGSYIVAKENLGTVPGLIAGAALLIDYTLTVAVSVAAGVAAITSANPAWLPHTVAICLGFILFIMLANCRGVRESGLLFATPTYLFIGSFLVMIVVGLWKSLTGDLPVVPPPVIEKTASLSSIVLPFLILRAFAGGCAAMTGTEAISNGIPAFRKPESKNAATTLVWMAVVLGVLFAGISILAYRLGIVPGELTVPPSHETVVSQIAARVFGRGWYYYLLQAVTAAILILAANTSFADFPRLSSLLAKDRFLPRQLANMGDRLVFSNGIGLLALLSAVLLIAFHGKVHSLIPLYAVGVFMSFTLSQFGMVKHAFRHKEKSWKRSAVISAIGGTTTALVTVVIAVMKFMHGAFVVVLLIPIIVAMFLKVNQHYKILAEQLRLPAEKPDEREAKNTVLILVPGIHRGVLPALHYAKSLSSDCRAVYIEVERESTALVEERWEEWGEGIPLVVLESPYRSVVAPLLNYLDRVKEEKIRHTVTVVIPEFVPAKSWHKLLHNQSGIMLKFALLFKRDIIVANVRYYLEK